MRRTALRDTEIGEVRIREGDKVVLWFESANRDEGHFSDPYSLDVRRWPNAHLAFGGGGPHFCLGAHIARIEIHALLRELLTRLVDVERAGDTEWLPSTFISGPKHLPIRFTA
jgi:cytochrome P450